MAWPKTFVIEDDVSTTLPAEAEAVRKRSESKNCTSNRTKNRKGTKNCPHSSTKKKSAGGSSWPTTVFHEKGQESAKAEGGIQDKKIYEEVSKKVPANELWPSATIFLDKQRQQQQQQQQQQQHIRKETHRVLQSRTTDNPSRKAAPSKVENKWPSLVLPESREKAQNQRFMAINGISQNQQQMEQRDEVNDLLVDSPVARKKFSFSAMCC